MAARTTKPGMCVYCRRVAALTDDHIPPRSLFGKPRPSDLISVPSCQPCNQRASLDDEYFKMMLALRYDTYDHPDVQAILPSVIRSLRKVSKPGYAADFIKTLRKVELRTRSGLYAGTSGAFNVKRERLDRVACRIAKGLYYNEKGAPLPSTHIASAIPDFVISGLPPSANADLPRLTAPLRVKEFRVIGRDVFRYRFAFFDDDPALSIWQFTFYGTFHYLAATLPKRELPVRPTSLKAMLSRRVGL